MALKDMNDRLSRIVGEVRAGTIATTSSQIAAGNMDLSSRTEAAQAMAHGSVLPNPGFLI
ncbi:hypothetical protein ACO0LC_10075 [Undibacterium sp. JH2W]|uniref:hypothetical protein n=1 Tax=Undibacterium sp. JH2W TaxID=3413037 RepID=UPI003BF1D45C